MRVIRTEIYFDAIAGAINPSAETSPGFSFVFLRNEDFPINHLGMYPDHADQLVPGSVVLNDNFSVASFVEFADAAMRGVPFQPLVAKSLGFRPDPSGVHNYYQAQSVSDSEIVIERSPPVLITVEGALKLAKSAPAAGIFIGCLGTYEPMLFLTIPAGIIVMGATFVVSKEIEKGLLPLLRRRLKKMYG